MTQGGPEVGFAPALLPILDLVVDGLLAGADSVQITLVDENETPLVSLGRGAVFVRLSATPLALDLRAAFAAAERLNKDIPEPGRIIPVPPRAGLPQIRWSSLRLPTMTHQMLRFVLDAGPASRGDPLGIAALRAAAAGDGIAVGSAHARMRAAVVKNRLRALLAPPLGG